MVTLKDIQNLKAKIKEDAKKGRRDEQILLDSLQDALTKDAKAKGGIAVNEDDELAVLYFQSGHMSDMFEKFSEILLIDGTYNVNSLGMPLYCFMVEDGFGYGRNVFYAATAEENAPHLLKIIQSFKASNSSWSQVQVIVIDKDFTELQTLQQEFPRAKVLFCQFHVIKYLFKQLAELDIAKENREEARELIRRLVHACSETEYTDLKGELLQVCNDAFKQYFTKCWDTCKVQWVSFLRDEYLHLANTTNNRLECHNQKLKDVTSRSMSLSEMFANVLLFCRTNAAEYSHKSFTEEFTSRNTENDDISGVREITSTCTAYAADRVVEQLKLSQTIQYQLTSESDGMMPDFVVAYNDHHHRVSLATNSCSCSFSKTMGLPCRHLFVVRAAQELPVFDLTTVARRWHKDYQILVGVGAEGQENESERECPVLDQENELEECPVLDQVEGECPLSVSSLLVKSRLRGTLSRNQKYTKVVGLGQKLATIVSECGMPDFRRRYDVIESIIHCWEKNVEIEVVPIQDTPMTSSAGEVSSFKY